MGIKTFCFQVLNSNLKIVQHNSSNSSSINDHDLQLARLKITFRTIMISISIIGVGGNILNLLTLRSPSLRTVPFKYIRALAFYDLISLTAILIHFLLEILHIDASPIIYYEVYVEDVLINSFLVAGLYVAVLLTIERYLLIRKPHKKSRLLSIENTVELKIALALLASLILHFPMSLQNTTKQNPITGRLIKGNNRKLLCREPYWTIFYYYKMLREFLRFFCVALLFSMNIVIAKSLQTAKKNRRLLIKRPSIGDWVAIHDSSIANISPIVTTSGTPPTTTTTTINATKDKARRDLNTLMKSFTEKKLTVLMASICLIYVIGNVPQMVVMVVQNEALNTLYGFQVFRNIANTLEVLNHCLNFFIFCMASSEYTRAFLINNCRFLHCCFLRIPFLTAFIHARRLNSLFEQPVTEFPSITSEATLAGTFFNNMKRKSILIQAIAQPLPIIAQQQQQQQIIYRENLTPKWRKKSKSFSQKLRIHYQLSSTLGTRTTTTNETTILSNCNTTNFEPTTTTTNLGVNSLNHEKEELWSFSDNSEQQQQQQFFGNNNNNKLVENVQQQNNKNAILLSQQFSLPLSCTTTTTTITTNLREKEQQKLPTTNGCCTKSNIKLQRDEFFQIKNFYDNNNLSKKIEQQYQNINENDLEMKKSPTQQQQQLQIEYYPEFLLYNFQENTDEYL